MSVLEETHEDDGYATLTLGGVIHRMQVFTTDPKHPVRHPLMVELDGMSSAYALLDQQDIDALHRFLEPFTTKQKEKEHG